MQALEDGVLRRPEERLHLAAHGRRRRLRLREHLGRCALLVRRAHLRERPAHVKRLGHLVRRIVMLKVGKGHFTCELFPGQAGSAFKVPREAGC